MGTLYYHETDKVKYMGRFRRGAMHGRGTEFDESSSGGVVVYQGTFRSDQRNGRGLEFYDGKIVYIGEFKVFSFFLFFLSFLYISIIVS